MLRSAVLRFRPDKGLADRHAARPGRQPDEAGSGQEGSTGIEKTMFEQLMDDLSLPTHIRQSG
jgi:hypothetical protein